MNRWLFPGLLAAMAALQLCGSAQAQQREAYEKLVATHAKANLVPEALVHRVIVRESKYHPNLIGHGGTIGLMQIKLATARGVGYQGDAEGLRDPDTNLAFGVKYLAGAYRAANGDHDRAVRYYAAGYYLAAKQQRLERERARQAGPMLASAPPKDAVKPEEAAKPAVAAQPEQLAKSEAAKPDVAKPEENGKPKDNAFASAQSLPAQPAPKPKVLRKKLAATHETVPRPPAGIPAGAKTSKPR